MPRRNASALAFVLLLGLAAPGLAGEGRPNVVLIYADDLGWGDVGFNGRRSWTTPNLDRLAREGKVFKRWYTAAVVCAPSRAAMLTGKYTIHCGVSRNDADLPAGQVTIAEALKARGYATALFGKWHHGTPRKGEKPYVHPMDQGFDEFFGFTDAVHAWEKFPETLWDGRAQVPVSGHSDDLFTDRAVDFLTRRKEAGGPFFLYLPYISAHFHIQAPEDEVARHRGKFEEADPSKPLNATYAAMVTRFDRNVGRVLDALDELKLADETLVVFTSDHGATFERGNQGTSAFHDSNAPFRGQKRTLWEGGIRVPACVRWPGHIRPGTISDDIVHMTDLFPTLCAAATNYDHPDPAWRVDGLNLLTNWVLDETAPCAPGYPRDSAFWEWRNEGSNQLAAMRGRWKLVVTNGGKPELFDVLDDPAERRDLSGLHPEIVKALQQGLKDWLATEAE